jgi:hypothetical protein
MSTAAGSLVGIDDANQDTDQLSAQTVPQIILRPVQIVHADGSAETVYIDSSAVSKQGQSEHDKNRKLHRQLSIVYIIIGTVALSLTAIATIIHLRKNHG